MTNTSSGPTQMELISRPVTQSAQAATEKLSGSDAVERGAVFTRREVVDLILNLVGYTSDKPLHKLRLLEPSFGGGDFLLPIVGRLLTSYKDHVGSLKNVMKDLQPAIRAVELHRETFKTTKIGIAELFKEGGIRESDSQEILTSWLSQGDFLLTPMVERFTHVIGNPPYLRQELIPAALMAEYRSRFQTIYDRADIYVPFIERSLFLLENGGMLGFICSDRWMKNRYGGPLRRLIAERFHLRYYVDMVNTPAFHSDVIAYPAITVIQNEKPGATRIARQPLIDPIALSKLATALRDDEDSNGQIKESHNVTRGSDPWILESWDQLAVVRRLESQFPTIEEAGCKVGIGVATGADNAFIGLYEDLDVEADRKLPLAMTRDILTGKVEWRGYGVVNPFSDDGRLVSLADYPKLAAHLNRYRAAILERHVSKKNPTNWYRTIDRIYPALAKKPKLLIPDIKGEASIVYEDGELYPHHNLYFIISDTWDLKALQAVLKSGIAKLFVSIYSTKMRGGYLRFQAQYLRRIRIPRWHDISPSIRNDLINASDNKDVTACNRAVSEMYRLTKDERSAIGE
ncbi:MAG: Eco57I restriction-modification methylase domain-containing protein [Pyrinomonadaceae bacterium]